MNFETYDTYKNIYYKKKNEYYIRHLKSEKS